MITIFTPTFNRAYLIDNLYQSLLKQTSYDFEWLVVDDGSTDNTEDFFSNIQSADNPFAITYIKQQNGGKHRAINAGVKLAKGELFFIVDSDDYLVPDAIEKIALWESQLDSSKKWAGVSGAKGYSETKVVGGVYTEKPYVDALNTERDKYNLGGDKSEAYFTDVLKKYPFPEFEGEKFISEDVVWNAIAVDGYYIRWYKDIIYICDYLPDGLTKSGNSKFINNPQGVLYWAKQQLKFFKGNTKKKLKAVNRYYEAVKDKKTLKQVAADLNITRAYLRLTIFSAKFIRTVRKIRKHG
jgi:glycosyltransferase involved in cell wall biosynthesis